MDDDDLPARALVQRAIEDMENAQRLTQAILNWSVELCAEAMDFQADCMEQWLSTVSALGEEAQAALTQTSARRIAR